jgi:hypothetical protein
LQEAASEWGVRDLEEFTCLGNAHDFGAPEIYEMPAHNLSVVFRKVERSVGSARWFTFP